MELTTNSNDDSRVTVTSSVSIASSSSGSNNKVQSSAIGLNLSNVSNSYINQQLSSPSLNKKIVSKNCNGTIVVTSAPSNDAELQLYRVMQRASLLAYYDTLLEMGGDDVQQLCDAGEEEFLEIMALVGMASKPLHVRRLQKSLQEWVMNPGLFQVPLASSLESVTSSLPSTNNPLTCCTDSQNSDRSTFSPSPRIDPTSVLSVATSPSPCHSRSSRSYSPLDLQSQPPSACSSPGPITPSVQSSPTLMESQITKLAAAAERLTKHLPQMEPKPHNTKKKMCKELEAVMAMSENDPRRMDQIRKYAAIYGRFDCKRKPEKPLTLHELSVNEAAAQMCRFVPALLTRRDELFPLARQVVRDAGYNYSKAMLQPSTVNLEKLYQNDKSTDSIDVPSPGNQNQSTDVHSPNKKRKIDSSSDIDDNSQSSNQTLLKKMKEEIIDSDS